MQNLIGIGAIVNGALYLAFVAIAALLWNDRPDAVLAIAAMGAAFFGYIAQAMQAPRLITAALVLGSWAIGATAGGFLVLAA